jgi:hypothetical protein
MTANDFFTVGELSSKWGIRRDRLSYAIERAGIKPCRRVGITRLFSVDQLPAIEGAVAKVRPYQPEAWALLAEGGPHE